jgi:hypothetical protein
VAVSSPAHAVKVDEIGGSEVEPAWVYVTGSYQGADSTLLNGFRWAGRLANRISKKRD